MQTNSLSVFYVPIEKYLIRYHEFTATYATDAASNNKAKQL